MLKAIHAQEDKAAARQKAAQVVEKLRERRLERAARLVGEGVEETLSYMDFPEEHWIKLRTNNPLERIMKEIRRRTRVVGERPAPRIVPPPMLRTRRFSERCEAQSGRLGVARLRHIAGTKWGTKKYMDMERLREKEEESAA